MSKITKTIRRETRPTGKEVLRKASVVGLVAPAIIFPQISIPIITSAITHPLKTIALATAGIIGGGILSESAKARKVAKETLQALPEKPEQIFELGKDIGGVIEGEKKDLEIVEGLKTAGLVGALATGGALIIPKIAEKFKEAETIISLPAEVKSISPLPVSADLPLEQPGELNKGLLPETVDITPKKRKRRAKKPTIPIHIINKNYLKAEIYC